MIVCPLTCFQDYGLNPKSRGKKRVADLSQERSPTVADSMQALNPMSKGKKLQSKSPVRQNWFDMAAEEVEN